MYLEHFGLSRLPFKITPDTSLFFEGSQRGAALGALIFAIKNGEGIIKVVGEVGSGKTMLCRMLEVKLSGDIDIVYIANPSLSPDNILHVIAHELELEITADSSKIDVMQKIQTYLLKKHADNRQVVMFVEEAQSMPVETLEEIRLLSNLETDQNKLLQMVLFGQPELDEKLSQNHIRQLKERITHSFFLEPFLPEDTFEYLNFRMRAVGYRGPDIFNHKTAGSVKKYSNGLTRRINILADKSLMASFAEGKHQVTVKHVKIAAKDSDFEKIGNNQKLIYGALIATSLIMAVWLGTLLPNMGPAVMKLSFIDPAIETSANVEVEMQQPIKKNKAKITQNEANKADNVAQINEIVDIKSGGGSEKIGKDADGVKSRIVSSLIEETLSSNQADDTLADKGAMTVSGIELQKVEKPSPAQANLFENRLKATEKWLSEVESKRYSIQLFLARENSYAVLEEFLGNVPESLDFNKIYIYETLVNKQPMYSVIYDDFISYSNALKVLNGLTDNIQINKPYVRRVRDLRHVSDLKKVSAIKDTDKMETVVTLNNSVNR